MTIQSARQVAKEVLEKHGATHIKVVFPHNPGLPFHAFAYVSWQDPKKICLNKHFVRLNGKKTLHEVVLHELAHAMDERVTTRIPDAVAHDEQWLSIYNSLGGRGWVNLPKYIRKPKIPKEYKTEAKLIQNLSGIFSQKFSYQFKQGYLILPTTCESALRTTSV